MLKYLLNIIVYLALTVWLGSLVFFGAGVASVLFQPDMLPGRTLAGAVNSAILARLGTIEIIAGVLLVGGTLYTAARYKHLLNWVVLLVSTAMLTTAIYYTGTLFPKMDALRTAIGDFDHVPAEKTAMKAEFDRGHQQYSMLVKCVLGAGFLVLIFHTVAMVRYTEFQANRYRTLEVEWLRLRERLSQPVNTIAKIISPADERSDPSAGAVPAHDAATNGTAAGGTAGSTAAVNIAANGGSAGGTAEGMPGGAADSGTPNADNEAKKKVASEQD